MDAADLLERALAAPPDSAERILFSAAGFGALVEADIVLVGGGAQVTHTGVGKVTDIDVTGEITEADEKRLIEAGFSKEGRHWVMEGSGGVIAVEVPAAELDGVEPPERIDVEGTTVLVISVTDLMMDRLIQTTDGTTVTYDEALQLAVAGHERIAWEKLRRRAEGVAAAEPFLKTLPALVDEFDTSAARLLG